MTTRGGSTKGMSSTSTVDQQKIDVARAFFDAMSAHDLDGADRTLADNFILEDPSTPGGGYNKSQARQYNAGFLTGFPDARFEILRTVAQGDYVVVQYIFSGTHTGPLVNAKGQTIPPSNRRVRVPGCVLNEVKEGKLTHSWDYWDSTTLLSQIGALPPI